MIRRFTVAIIMSLGVALALGRSRPLGAGQPGSGQPATTSVDGRSVTVLPDGRWLLLGGQGTAGPLGAAVLVDPSTQTTTPLTAGLREPRAWHSATVLADGSVLIFGGRGADGQPLATAERFDPGTLAFGPMPLPDALPRAGHTATLLTDGRLLIVGGETTGQALATAAEAWRVDRVTSEAVTGPGRRAFHTATLLGDGRVLVRGGRNQAGLVDGGTEFFDPATNRLEPVPPPQVPGLVAQDDPAQPLTVTAVVPADGTQGVATDAPLTVRFSHAARPDAVTDQTLVLTGPNGTVETRVIAAEGGRLAFVWPAAPLQAATTYTLTIAGVADAAGQVAPPVRSTFTTAASTPGDTTDPEDWTPDPRTGWRTNRPPSPFESLPPLLAPAGATAISGRVLTLDGRPLPGVTLEIEDEARVESDRTGRFLLVVPQATATRRVLHIDGQTASRPGKTYGFYEYGLTPTPGQTLVLPFTIWMTKLDTRHVVSVPSPTTQAVVITTPAIPGLELHLPPQTTITGEDGRPVTQVGLTAIPVDRPPFPLARNVEVPVYFTAQPGGAYVTTGGAGAGAWLVYPNYHGGHPGELAQFFHYDPEEKDWYVYGVGQVSADATRVVPNARTRFYAFTGAMINAPGQNPPPEGPAPGSCQVAGKPVDLSTGLEVLEQTDLTLPDVLPLSLTRTYRSRDTASRAFGIGTTFTYGIFLWSAQQYTEADLVLPDGGRVHYVRTSAGTSWTDAVFASTVTPTARGT